MKGTYLMAGKTLSAVCKNKKEITFTESLDESEVIAIMAFCKAKKIGCVYLQNSGLSNAINPIISIADKQVYSIPLVLI